MPDATSTIAPGRGSAAYASHAWLAVALPVDARRFRIADRRLAFALQDADAELVDRSPDVEIAPVGALRGDAALAIVSVGDLDWAGGPLSVRAVRRCVASARMRMECSRSQRALRRLGYANTAIATWDLHHRLRVPRLAGGERFSRRIVEYLPRCGLVLGWQSDLRQTLLQAAIEDAGTAVGSRLEPSSVSMQGGFALVMADGGLVRVAVGPARAQIGSQLNALDALRAAPLPDAVARRVPWPLAKGRSGLADWSLEQLLPGKRPRTPLSNGLLEQCVDFLVALHGAGCGKGHGPSCAAAADVVATMCAPVDADLVRGLARELDAELSEVPRGFGHGDFFSGNLLVERDELVGVVDWDAAGPGRLPLVDFLQLTFLARHRPSDVSWGPTLVRQLLPWARRGGDVLGHEYCRRIGIDPEPRLLRALVLAYWLDRTAYQLRTHAERRDQRGWLAANIDSVVRSLEQGMHHPAKRA